VDPHDASTRCSSPQPLGRLTPIQWWAQACNVLAVNVRASRRDTIGLVRRRVPASGNGASAWGVYCGCIAEDLLDASSSNKMATSDASAFQADAMTVDFIVAETDDKVVRQVTRVRR
jgi:hypothetical protein